MSYFRAEEILPLEIIELIQEYVDGESIYIPKKKENRKKWGENTYLKQELKRRNRAIYEDYKKGLNCLALSDKYYLSIKSIQRILREMKQIT